MGRTGRRLSPGCTAGGVGQSPPRATARRTVRRRRRVVAACVPSPRVHLVQGRPAHTIPALAVSLAAAASSGDGHPAVLGRGVCPRLPHLPPLRSLGRAVLPTCRGACPPARAAATAACPSQGTRRPAVTAGVSLFRPDPRRPGAAAVAKAAVVVVMAGGGGGWGWSRRLPFADGVAPRVSPLPGSSLFSRSARMVAIRVWRGAAARPVTSFPRLTSPLPHCRRRGGPRASDSIFFFFLVGYFVLATAAARLGW